MTRGRTVVSGLLDAAKEGQFTVPDEITEGVATLERIEAAWNDLPEAPPVDIAASTLADEIYDAAWAGTQLPNLPKRWAALKFDAEVVQVAAQVLRGVLERSDDRLLSVFHGQVDAILLDHLKPALAELLAGAESLVPKLDRARTERDAVAKGQKTLSAWQQLHGMALRYAGLRNAYNLLWREVLRQRTEDDGGLFAELENAREVNPFSALARQTPPWPTEPTERCVWIIASEARPWLPTPEEQDQALAAERERNAELMATPAMRRT